MRIFILGLFTILSTDQLAAQTFNSPTNPNGYGTGWGNVFGNGYGTGFNTGYGQGFGNSNIPYSQYPTMGYLPNGTRVINPWVSTQTNFGASPFAWNYNYQAYQQSVIWNPSLNPYLSINNPWNTPQVMLNQAAYFNRPVQVENGAVLPVAPGIGVNPVTGTVVNSFRGIALTNEGPFYRVPNTGSITAWGRYIPGTGVYVNPFTGSAYNPASGLIVR